MCRRIHTLLLGLTSVLLLAGSVALAQRPPQDRVPDPPAVQREGATRDDTRHAPPAPQQMNDVDEESPLEHGTVIAVASDGSATVRTARGESVPLPPGDWEVGDAVACVTRGGRIVCDAE